MSPVVGLATFSGCSKNAANNADEKLSADTTKPVPAIDMSALDTTISPKQDFYLYVNKGWMEKHPLTGAYSRYGTFDVLRERNTERLHAIVEEMVSKKFKKGTNEYRVSVLYKQAMDSVTRNKLGAEPIKPRLAEIEAIQNKEDLAKKAAEWDNLGDGTLFGTAVYADDKNSTMNIMHLGQPGLALGDKDSYLDKDERTLKNLKAYEEYTEKILALAGYSPEETKRMAENNIKISKEIAQMIYSHVELRDPQRNYNKIEVKKFVEENKSFDWATYLKIRNLDTLSTWNVGQLDYFKKFNNWFANVDLRALKDFLIVNEIDGAAGALSDDFNNASFDFYGKVLSGRKEQHPRWKRAVNTVNNVLGEALGQVYVDKYFKPEAKEKMLKLVKNLQHALGQRIEGLTWMSEATKAKAQEKLNNFTIKIGYPDKWKDYSKLNIDENNTYYENLQAVRLFEHNRNMADLGKPVDRSKWLMNPQDINAYYMPTTNEICFPAGILQPPFFNENADDAVNYGAIGVVIGHEMTHGFDDNGCQYDKDGNLNNWWTKEDKEKFDKETAKLAAQFDKIVIAPGLHANGKFTLGENIADQGGLLISYLALHNALNGKEVAPIDGFTPEQRFYIAYARVWGQNITPEERINLTKMDPHSLGEYRVNQTLKNIDTFFKAFDIKEGDAMYLAPADRAVVW